MYRILVCLPTRLGENLSCKTILIIRFGTLDRSVCLLVNKVIWFPVKQIWKRF